MIGACYLRLTPQISAHLSYIRHAAWMGGHMQHGNRRRNAVCVPAVCQLGATGLLQDCLFLLVTGRAVVPLDAENPRILGAALCSVRLSRSSTAQNTINLPSVYPSILTNIPSDFSKTIQCPMEAKET